MGFEKTVKYFSNNWSEKVEKLFAQSFLFAEESIYPHLFKLFCSKKFKDGIIFILNSKATISNDELMIMQDNLDEYTTKDILLMLLSGGPQNYSKILFIAENLQNSWIIEFVFYILNKANIQSLSVMNINNFANNVNSILKNSDTDTKCKIIKIFEKNISFWKDLPAMWNMLLNYEYAYEIFMKHFFGDSFVFEQIYEFLKFIDCKHYIKIMNFLNNTPFIEKKFRNNFHQFLFKIEVPQFLEAFLDFLSHTNINKIAEFSSNFSTIPFFHIAITQKEFDGRKLLLYLFFIYSSSLQMDNKMNLSKELLDSDKIINLDSVFVDDLPLHFVQTLVSLDIKSNSGLFFVLEVVDKKGDINLINNLAVKHKDSPESIKPRINEILVKHSLKSVILNEKKDLNMSVVTEILKKVPVSVTNDIISLIYSSTPNVKMRLIKLIELINYDRGVEKIIETLIYKDKDKKVRATCIRLLKLLKEDEALKHLRILLFDEDSRVRANAVEIFEYFANADNWFVLLALANDSNNRVRGNVAKAIFQFSRKHSIEILNGMINSNQESFVLSALWAIEKLALYDEFINTLQDLSKKYISVRIKNKLNRIFANMNKVRIGG